MINKMMKTGKPDQLKDMIRKPRSREKAKLTMVNKAKNSKHKRNHSSKTIKQYNNMKNEPKIS